MNYITDQTWLMIVVVYMFENVSNTVLNSMMIINIAISFRNYFHFTGQVEKLNTFSLYYLAREWWV